MVPGWTFDARQHTPQQGTAGGHPVGKFKFTITKTECVANKDNTGGMLRVTFTSDKGSINNNYNLWNQNEVAVKIANGELSALCHAVGRYNLASADASELLNAQGVMEVDYQSQTAADKAAGKTPYVQVKKIFTVDGNEPGTTTAPAGNAPPGVNTAPQQAASAPWANQAPAAAPAATSPPAGNSAPWQQGQAAPAGAQPAWNTAPAPGASPPWAQK